MSPETPTNPPLGEHFAECGRFYPTFNAASPCTCGGNRQTDPPAAPVPTIVDAAEMLWVVLANVSSGDWTQQSIEWQEAAARWRDNYFTALNAASVPGAPTGTEERYVVVNPLKEANAQARQALKVLSPPAAPTGTDAGVAALVERRVPEVFASGSDRDNAAKAWLHGYDTASQQRGLCSGCGIDRDHCQWSKQRGSLACCPDCKHDDDAARELQDADRERWRSVSGPYAELTGPLIRFAGLVRAAALAQQAKELKRRETIMEAQRSELMEIKALFGLAAGGVGRSLVEEITFQLAQQATQLQEEQREFREWLWINHSCSVAALYGDDGEMQCGGPVGGHGVLDFKRDEVGLIVRRLQQVAESQLTSLRAELSIAAEQEQFWKDACIELQAALSAAQSERDEAREQFDRHVAWADEQSTSLRAELATAKTNAEDADNVRERLATLLSLTATALKGEPEPLHLHDWSDLPKRVEALRAELESAQQAHETALEAVIRERDAEHMEVLAAEYALAEARRALDAEQQDNTRLLAALDAIGARHNAGPYPRKEDHHEP